MTSPPAPVPAALKLELMVTDPAAEIQSLTATPAPALMVRNSEPDDCDRSIGALMATFWPALRPMPASPVMACPTTTLPVLLSTMAPPPWFWTPLPSTPIVRSPALRNWMSPPPAFVAEKAPTALGPLRYCPPAELVPSCAALMPAWGLSVMLPCELRLTAPLVAVMPVMAPALPTFNDFGSISTREAPLPPLPATLAAKASKVLSPRFRLALPPEVITPKALASKFTPCTLILPAAFSVTTPLDGDAKATLTLSPLP